MSRPEVRAAGGVLWRGDPAAPEVALVHRPAYDDWSLPKGKAKAGEHVLLTAAREVREETGYEPRLGSYVTATRYTVTTRRGRPADKTVHYWAMRACGGDFVASGEVDALRWLPLGDAGRAVDAARDGRVLDAFARTPRDTVALVVVRHGSTASRRSGRGRPAPGLDRSGRAQARALAQVLAGLGARRLLAADLPACAQMLEPYAATAGLDVALDRGLSGAASRGRERERAAAVRAEAVRAAGDGPLVVCGQRRLVAALVDTLGRASGRRPPEPLAVEKGGWWLLHHRGGHVLAFERHAPAG